MRERKRESRGNEIQKWGKQSGFVLLPTRAVAVNKNVGNLNSSEMT